MRGPSYYAPTDAVISYLVIAETGVHVYLSIWGKLKCADQYTGARWIMGYK